MLRAPSYCILLVLFLCNDGVSIWQTSGGRMNNELEWIRKEVVADIIEVLPRYLLEVTRENYEHRSSRFPGRDSNRTRH
jgi:translation initiation factor IF-1